MNRQRVVQIVVVLAAVAVAVAPVGSEPLFGVTNTSLLIKFDSAAPGTILSSTPITGLDFGDSIKGIDFRPATSELYALGIITGVLCDITLVNACGRLYRIDPATGAATRVGPGPFSTTLDGSAGFYGFDFNPFIDRIRVVNTANENFRLNPNTGTLLGPDAALNPPGSVVGSAYDRSFAGTSATTLFGIDAASDRLVRQGGVDANPSPNGGVLTTIGLLGVNTEGVVGFDVSGATGIAYAALRVSAQARLYTINLATGAATFVGTIGDGTPIVTGLAVAPPKNVLVAGAGPGGGPHVRVFDASGAARLDFFAFAPAFTGGVRTALCDVNGDGVADIVAAAGPGGGPHVRVFSGVNGLPLSGAIGSFFAFDQNFAGGVTVGCADLNGDGKGDVIVGAGAGGGPHVRVFNGATGNEIAGPLGSFFPYAPAFTGGVFVGGD